MDSWALYLLILLITAYGNPSASFILKANSEMNRLWSFSWRFAQFLVLAIVLALPAAAEEELLKSGSRATFVHRINLYDDSGMQISPKDAAAPPFSTRVTCGKCHPYEQIAKGWHFNSVDKNASHGRPGQPWVLFDQQTGTQLPLSYRGWKGTYDPDTAGLSAFEFSLRFGRHFPGGGPGEKRADETAPGTYWPNSGKLEIDCMACHNADNTHDQTLRDAQVKDMNFKWVPTITNGLGSVQGAVKDIAPALSMNKAGEENPFADPTMADPTGLGAGGGGVHVKLIYDPTRFDANDRVLLNITSKVSPNRCYYCHTTAHGGKDFSETDVDIHLTKAGMSCVDCHRNGLEHATVRGFDGETTGSRPHVATLSCSGCHYGLPDKATTSSLAMGGRLGSPRPAHVGLPPIHLKKLTCTACHSGPWPEKKTELVQTSMAHGLGLTSRDRGPHDPPFIAQPVFLKQQDGKIGPHSVIWPSFWGKMQGNDVKPMLPGQVASLAGAVLGDKNTRLNEWKPLTDAQTTATLSALAQDQSTTGTAVFVTGGKLYQLGEGGKLVASNHPAAAPYAWPLAHEVRPAQQALGSNGCTDCHSANSNFYFGEVTAAGFKQIALPPTTAMYDMQGEELGEIKLWNMSFVMRPLFKFVGLAACGVIALVLLAYGLAGLRRLLRALSVR